MRVHLTERFVRTTEPADDEVALFGLRVTEVGAKSFIQTYRVAGRARRITIGSWPDWSVTAAREKARELKRRIDDGDDPLEKQQTAREAATVKELIDRYIEEHVPKLAKRNGDDQISMLGKLVEPEWGPRKVADITSTDVDKLLAKIAAGRKHSSKQSPKYKRKKQLRSSRPTPVRGRSAAQDVQSRDPPPGNAAGEPGGILPPQCRERARGFLTMGEIGSLAAAIEAHPNQCAAKPTGGNAQSAA